MVHNASTSKPSPQTQRFLQPFAGQAASPPPLWLMRQAGRYLPEYRDVRATAGGFLNLCYTPKLACEVTLQPIRRYGFDAAIMFSDILVVPHALGQNVWFAEGEGPRLDPINTEAGLSLLNRSGFDERIAPVYEAIELMRHALPSQTALIGFCGAPWTVATYVVAGRGSPDQEAARRWGYADPAGFGRLIDLLADVSVDYLSKQIQHGVNTVQIFDSWAGTLPDDEFGRWVIAPTKRMVTALKARHPATPIIGFPRASGLSAVRYAVETGVDGLGCDTSQPLAALSSALGTAGVSPVLQGNLDPMLLVAGGPRMAERVHQILDTMAGRPFIFNLGHGIVPQTPPEHVADLVRLVRGEP